MKYTRNAVWKRVEKFKFPLQLFPTINGNALEISCVVVLHMIERDETEKVICKKIS